MIEEDGKAAPTNPAPRSHTSVVPGSLLHISSSLVQLEEGRARIFGEARRQGSIHPNVLASRKQYVKDFLEFLNARHGPGAVGHMKLADLTMTDVEAYNQSTVEAKYSHSTVVSRLQIVEKIIDRGG